MHNEVLDKESPGHIYNGYDLVNIPSPPEGNIQKCDGTKPSPEKAARDAWLRKMAKEAKEKEYRRLHGYGKVPFG